MDFRRLIISVACSGVMASSLTCSVRRGKEEKPEAPTVETRHRWILECLQAKLDGFIVLWSLPSHVWRITWLRYDVR
jgi:hypothetical protein